MYSNEDTIKLFDANNNFVADFDKKIEEVEIALHGQNYYDLDEEIVDTNAIPIQKEVEMPKVVKKEKGISIKDFLPALFMLLIFGVVVYAGYYFLNNFDVSTLINHG
ncbi:MAG: hypothetical protein IKP76_04555 [Bacilli bacterium]|nr:hypothetical protein [Bacilli bacterium]